MNTKERIELANKILPTFGQGFRLERKRGGFYLSWDDWREGRPRHCKRVVLKRNNLLVFSFPSGATVEQAIATLIRYVRGQSVYPLGTWRRWASGNVLLWRDQNDRDYCLSLLSNSDYPKHPDCIFCGRSLEGKPWDWYSTGDRRKAVDGTGCHPADPGGCTHHKH